MRRLPADVGGLAYGLGRELGRADVDEGVRPRALERHHLAVHRGVAYLVGLLHDDALLGLLAESVEHALEVVLAEVVVLHQDGHLGLGPRGQDVLGEGAAFELVGGLPAHGPGEVLRIAPARGTRGDEQLGHLALVHVAMHGLVVRGAQRAEHQQHAVALDQLARLLHALGGVVGVVGGEVGDLAAVDAALGIDLGEVGRMGLAYGSVGRHGTRVGHEVADADLGVAGAGVVLLLGLGWRLGDGRQGQRQAGDQGPGAPGDGVAHGCLLACGRRARFSCGGRSMVGTGPARAHRRFRRMHVRAQQGASGRCVGKAWRSARLAGREHGLALLHEGLHAFHEGRRAHQLALAFGLVVKLLLQRGSGCVVQRAAGFQHGAGRQPRQACGRGQGLLAQGLVVHAGPDQAPVGGLLRAQPVAQQGQAQGARTAQPALDEPGGAQVRHDAQARQERQVEVGRARRQRHVAGQGQAHAGPGCRAVDGADHGHGQLLQVQDEAVGQLVHVVGRLRAQRAAIGLGPALCPALRAALRAAHGRQVRAHAKPPALGGEHQGAEGGVLAHLGQQFAQPQLQGPAQRIHAGAVLEDDEGDLAAVAAVAVVAVAFHADGRTGIHGGLLWVGMESQARGRCQGRCRPGRPSRCSRPITPPGMANMKTMSTVP